MVISRFAHGMVATGLLTVVSGCIAPPVNSPVVTNRLQLISAGHTGCQQADNVISNVVANLDGSGSWNATCKGKMYLCTAVSSAGSNAESFSCAPAVD
jgi:hypothetical protein